VKTESIFYLLFVIFIFETFRKTEFSPIWIILFFKRERFSRLEIEFPVFILDRIPARKETASITVCHSGGSHKRFDEWSSNCVLSFITKAAGKR
tara:strand:+ start:85326 stop:85607 length:282 start_codon:yes stop_codon:yes gene_type:complete